MRKGNKPKTNPWRIVANDMKEHLKGERERINRDVFDEGYSLLWNGKNHRVSPNLQSELIYGGNFVPYGDYVYNKESRALNRLLGLDTTDGINKWYKQ